VVLNSLTNFTVKCVCSEYLYGAPFILQTVNARNDYHFRKKSNNFVLVKHNELIMNE